MRLNKYINTSYAQYICMDSVKEACDMRGMLSFLILFLLSKKSMCGQELATELEKRKGEKPSCGTIYPALKNLKESGLIAENTDSTDGKTVKYELTKDGKDALKVSKEKFLKAFEGIY